MKNKLLAMWALASMLILALPSCVDKTEKLNLYGVQPPDASRTSPQAYLAFFILLILLIISLIVLYKKITKK